MSVYVRYRILGIAAMSMAVLASCSSSSGAPPGSTLVSPSVTPSAATPTVEPSTPEPSVPTASAEPTLEPPPIAMLMIGGHAYPGKIGGYTWKSHGDAAPWLPARALDPVSASARSHVTVKLDGATVAHWTATMARASDTGGTNPTGIGEGARTISFDGPRSGSWVVSVAVEYAGDLGDGAYYWRLDVR
jgi:hypothetical protein